MIINKHPSRNDDSQSLTCKPACTTEAKGVQRSVLHDTIISCHFHFLCARRILFDRDVIFNRKEHCEILFISPPPYNIIMFITLDAARADDVVIMSTTYQAHGNDIYVLYHGIRAQVSKRRVAFDINRMAEFHRRVSALLNVFSSFKTPLKYGHTERDLRCEVRFGNESIHY